MSRSSNHSSVFAHGKHIGSEPGKSQISNIKRFPCWLKKILLFCHSIFKQAHALQTGLRLLPFCPLTVLSSALLLSMYHDYILRHLEDLQRKWAYLNYSFERAEWGLAPGCSTVAMAMCNWLRLAGFQVLHHS